VGRLRTVLLVLATAGVLAPSGAAPAGAAQAVQTTSLDSGVLVGINRIRVDHDLAPLTMSSGLSQAAQAHSFDMVARGYFGHSSANGTPFWKRIQAYYPIGPYHSWSVGENLLWSPGTIGAGAALAEWMASPEHRANILDPGYRQVGIGVASAPHAPGTFDGDAVTVITTDFGARH
jgi:uncharacterized protein YkwD